MTSELLLDNKLICLQVVAAPDATQRVVMVCFEPLGLRLDRENIRDGFIQRHGRAHSPWARCP